MSAVALASPAAPVTSFQLEADEAHCWLVSLDAPPKVSARLHATLSADERARGERFHFERDRRRFVIARGALREILARYLWTNPGEIEFVYNEYGKPDLAGEYAGRVGFNLSHSNDLALIGIGNCGDIGVDVEYIRVEPDFAAIAQRFFSSAEVECLSAVPSDRYAEAFFGIWTKKEAYIKARGEGLSIPLNRFSVPPAIEPGQTCVDIEGRPWSLSTLRPAPGYIAALAMEGASRRLRPWQWNTR